MNRTRYALSLVLGLTTPIAYAANILPASVDPARVNQESAPIAAPLSSPNVTVPAFKPTPVSPGAHETKFILKQLNITGSTVYGNHVLESMFQSYIGHPVSLTDLQQIADTITIKYRNDGFILTKAIVPAQSINGGVVTIRVVEGYINQVNIQGDAKGAYSLLQAYGAHIIQERPLNIAALERYVLLANDISGIQVRAILSPTATPPHSLAPNDSAAGAADLTFVVEQHTASGYVGFDNRGTRYLGPNEYSVGGNVNSIFRSGDVTGIQGLVTTDFNELQYLRLYHQTPLGSNGMQLNLATSYSRSEPGFTLEPLDVQGRSVSASADVTYPIFRSRNQNLSVSGGFDMLNSKTDILSTLLYDDHIRSLRAGVNYDSSDRFYGINQVGLQASQGISVFGASQDDDTDLSRPNGRPQYTKFNANASRLQSLGHQFSFLVATQGQYTNTPLLSAEAFGFGGAQFGLAYDPSEITGDRGVAAKAELRYDTQPNFRFLRTVQYFTEYDIGKIWNLSASTSGLPASASGASASIGFRANFNQYLSGTFTLAKPLTRDVATEGNKNLRGFFTIALAGDTPSNIVAIPLPPLPVQTTHSGTGLTRIHTDSADDTADDDTTTPYPTSRLGYSNQFIATSSSSNTTFNSSAADASAKTASSPSTDDSQHDTGLTAVNNTDTSESSGKHYYTLQLMSGRNLASLKQFAAKNNMGDKTNIVHTQYEGGDWYVLGYGQYSSPSAADSAKLQLSAALRHLNPWVRHIG